MKIADRDLTANRLRELLSYDKRTGEFVWISGPRPNRIGTVAGGITTGGYMRLMVDGQRYQLHRLAWLHATGKWPKSEIDHINGNKLDNRKNNLRFCNNNENRLNILKYKSNTSGHKGVFWHKQGKKYMSRIRHNHKMIYLGLFKTAKQASKAYKKEAKKLQKEFFCKQ